MPRLRKPSDIRWYLYRSSTKLEMLYDQLVSTSGPFTGSLSVDVPGIKASIGTPSQEEPTDDERLDLIETELRARNLVGTIASPGEYIGGEMPMRWGLYNDQGSRPADEPPLVFFGGVLKDEAIVVGLGGSSKNVVGHDGASSTYSRSTTRALVDWLVAGLAEQSRPDSWRDPDTEEYEVLSSVTIALHYLRPPTQRLKFLAKTLMFGVVAGHEHMTGFAKTRVILATPLYVVMSEAPRDEERWGLDDQW